jgi:hypothetical protein
MAEVVHSLTSADGRLRVEVIRRPTGGYQLTYSRFRQQSAPEYCWKWEGWVSVPGQVTLTDSPERGAVLAAEKLALWECQEAESDAAADGRA